MTKLLNEFLVGLRPMDSFLKEEPESGFNAPFGKYAFDDKRKDVPQDQKEPSTPEEEKALDGIETYMDQNSKDKLDAVAPMLVNLAKQGKYAAVLDPSGTQFVYRILEVKRDVAQKMLNVASITDEAPFGAAAAGVLQPNKNRTSGWTSDINLVKSFSPLGDGGDCLILVKAAVKGNAFFGKPGDLARAISPGFTKEMETIAVGPVRFVKAAYCLTIKTDGQWFDHNAPQKLIELIG
jgi:hypothetical protein